MAGILSNVQTTLQNNFNNIATNASQWINSIVPIVGSNGISHNYRVLRVPNLTRDNPFFLLEQNVARGSANMALQTLIATPRAGTQEFYLLNSQQQMTGGTGTCDLLLVYT